MSIVVINTYRTPETYTRYEEVRVRGVLTNPSSIKIYIWNPAGDLIDVNGVSMDEETTGKYVYHYDIPASPTSNGRWHGFVEASGTNGEARDYFQFEVTGG